MIDSEGYNSQIRRGAVEVFLDASDLFSIPGGFSSPVEALIQKGFVVRLVSSLASVIKCCQRDAEVILKAAVMCIVRWVAYSN